MVHANRSARFTGGDGAARGPYHLRVSDLMRDSRSVESRHELAGTPCVDARPIVGEPIVARRVR